MLPIYLTIENDIKEQIKSGQLKTGDKIPSENELGVLYNVSRMTVRQAMNNLVNEGFLLRHKGKGTFVSNTKIEKNIQGVRSFTEEIESTNRKVSSKVITFTEELANKAIAEKLFLEENEPVYKIERIRYGDDTPILFELLYLPKNLFKDIPKSVFNGSFYQYIEDTLNLKISHCLQTIEAKMPSAKVLESLHIGKNTPILFIIRNTFLNNGRPFEYVESSYRADQYKFIQTAFKI